MAKKDFQVHIDMNKQEIMNARVQNLSTAPTALPADIGLQYWNTVDNKPYIWTGTAWLDMGSVYTHPTYAGTGQPSSALTGAQVISRITLTNGHVTGVTTRSLTAADIGAATALHTHAFSDITGLPTNTILGNNTTGTGPAKALTVSDLMTMMAIAFGSIALLNAGTDTVQRTWTAKDISDFVISKVGNFLTVVNLSYTASATNGVVTNSAGTNATIPAATTTNAGLMLPAEKVKLTNIAPNANNYVHPTDNPGAHPFSAEITTGLQVLSQLVVNNEGHVVAIKGRGLTAGDIAGVFIRDAINNGTDTTWSSGKIYNEIQTAIGQAQTGALIYQPVNYTPSTTAGAVVAPPPITSTTIKSGMVWVVTTAGFFGTDTVEPGDMVIAKVDNAGTTATNYQIVNKNIPAIVSATTLVEGIVRLATVAETTTGTLATVAVTPAGLKAALDAKIGSHTVLFGDGSTTNFNIAHTLNSIAVQVMIQRVSDGAFIECEVKAASATTVTVGVNIPPANNAYRILIDRI